MKRNILHVSAVFLMALSVLPVFAQIGSGKDGFYRVRNSQYPSDYIGVANDKFSYHSLIGSASTAAQHLDSKLSQATAYLKNDAHIYQDTEFISPATLIYILSKSNTSSNKDYNLIAQGTSLRTLATGCFQGTYSGSFTFDKWVYIEKVSGSGLDAKYRASIQLKNNTGAATMDLGYRYFRDEIVDGKSTFTICPEEEITEEAYWYLEPVTYFNIVPEVEYNGKYYTTLKVPFKWKVSSGSSVEKIHVVTDASNGILQLQEITGTIPEGTPVILECGSNNPLDCKLEPIGVPKFSPASTSNKSAPAADEASYYTGTNLLEGTYYCNTDGNVPYLNTSGTTSNLNGNHYTRYDNIFNPSASTSVNKKIQKYILGIGESGNLGFVKATATNPAPSGILPANKAWLMEQAELDADVAMPIFSIPGGTYDQNPLSVTLSCATPGATIYYTKATGNNTPATPTASSTMYTGPITVTTTTTIKAIAILGNSKSAVPSHTYTFQVATPVISFEGGSSNTATITCSTEGATIYYTTNGSNPTTSSTVYTGPIPVSGDVTIKARAYLTGLSASAIATATYKTSTTSVIASPTPLTINDSGTGNTFNVAGYTLNVSTGWLADNSVDLTNSNSNFSAALSATTGTASSTYFNPSNGSLAGKVAMNYNGRLLKDNGTVTLTYAGKSGVKASVAVNYVSDIYIVTDNGVQDQWNFNGAKMNYKNGIYTATFIAPADNTYILFSRKASLASNERWGTRYVFGPSGSGDWVMPSDATSKGGILDVNDDNPIKLPYAGEYIITINTNPTYYPFTITRKVEKVATPTFTPAAGTYSSTQNVTIECETDGATIHYTTDGSEPTTDSPVYSSAITLSEATTIKAIAVKEGWINSATAEATYTFIQTVATPTFTPAAGTYNSTQNVTIECETDGATIHYTTDGSEPTADSPVFSSAITVSETTTIKAIAVMDGWNNSPTAEATYTIQIPELNAEPKSLTINDSGQDNTFSVQGQYLGTDNVGVTRTNNDFVPSLSATTGTATNNASNWYYTPNGGSLNGSVDVTYQGRELNATTTINVANDLTSTSVNVTYKPDLYLIGNYGGSGWNYANGTNMNEADGIYTTTITIPANGDSYIMFARKTGETYDWNDQGNGGNRYFFGASTDGGDWVYTGAFDGGNLELTPTHNNKYCPIKFPQDQAGTYTITVNANNNTFTITKVMTLADIVNDGEVGCTYVISDDILGVYIAEKESNKVYAKDLGLYRNPVVATGEQIDYVKDVAHLQSGDWDQSNWVMLEFDSNVEASQFANGIINGGTLSGVLTDKQNPTMQVTGYQIPEQMTSYATNNYVTANFMDTQVQHSSVSDKDYFFIQPKPQEYVYINWAMYDGGTHFSAPNNQDNSNEAALLGSFNVDWSLYPGNPETDFEAGLTYNFHAIVRYTSRNRDGASEGGYAVYPCQNDATVTAIVENWNDMWPVEVMYVNVMGQTSDKPFDGLNIIVTRYSNGTITTTKVIK
jgi:hypothetical protein